MLVLQFVAMVISDPEIPQEYLNPAPSSSTFLNGRKGGGSRINFLTHAEIRRWTPKNPTLKNPTLKSATAWEGRTLGSRS